MKIFIPTRGRAHSQGTWDNVIPERWKDDTTLVCPKEEIHKHEKQRRNVIASGKEGNIGIVRQWIIDTCKDPKVMMLDDDFKGIYELTPTDENKCGIKYTHMKKKKIAEFFDMIEKLLDRYAMVGIAYRGGAHRNWPNMYVKNGRIFTAWAVRTDILHKHDIRFDAVVIKEDFHVNLCLLELGYENITVTGYCHDPAPSNAKGGCSSYRDLECMIREAKRLKKLHPGFVDYVMVKTKWCGFSEGHPEVRVKWKKALESGVEKYGIRKVKPVRSEG